MARAPIGPSLTLLFATLAAASCTHGPTPHATAPAPSVSPSSPPASALPASRVPPDTTPHAYASRAGELQPAPPAPLPPIPSVDGPLAIKVIYPNRNQELTTRDSNFILGSVGSGQATLSINGARVPVLPNGAFLAWLPVPRGDSPHYELIATKAAESITATVPITLRPLPLALPDTGKLLVDRSSVTPPPSARAMLRSDERVRISIRAPSNARLTLRTADGTSRPMQRTTGVNWSTEVSARDLIRAATIIARRDADSISVETGAVTLTDATPRRWAELINTAEPAPSDTDQVVQLRPAPDGTYKWFLLPGTVVEVTGHRAAYSRVRLDDQLEAWVEDKALNPRAEGTSGPRRTASNARVVASAAWSDVRIPVTDRPAYQVEERRDALVLTLYATTSNVDVVNFSTNDDVIRDVTWEQATSDRVRFTVHLRRAPYGYLALWDRGAFVLRVRRAPQVDAARPLAGRVIVVDPGHPPIGSTGPTGLYEGDAVLAVAQQLKPMLESRGATVVLTRNTRDAVALGDRPVIARRANADVLVSIHLNALPDGANPLRTNGTGTYFFHDHSEALARAVQRGLVREMGLRDLGINYDNLQLARPTWMPAILCEGAFVIVPEQEAALRDVGFQQRYAMGILSGLEEYFRGIAAEGGR